MIPLARTVLGCCLGWLVVRLAALLGRLGVGSSLPARVATRRAFVRNAALGSVGAALAVVGAGFGALMWPNKTGAFGGVVTVPAADVPAVGGPPFRHTAGHFYLARNPDGLLALWWKCPHLGCAVPWVGPPDSPHAYQCPCHGSTYDYNGVRTGGPAPRPLDLMAVRLEGDSVQVDTGAITTRAGYARGQAVPFPA